MTDSISWRNPKVLRVLAIVFIAGGLSGAVSYRMARMYNAYNAHPPGPQPLVLVTKDALGKLQRDLNLTPTQCDQVSAIIDDYKKLYGNIQDQYDEVRATGKNRIIKVLDPDQRIKFEKIAAEMK